MSGSKFIKRTAAVSVILVALAGFAIRAQSPSLPGISQTASNPADTAAEKAASGGIAEENVQAVTTIMTSPDSYPTITVKKDIPVVWTFKADESVLNDCNSTVVLPDCGVRAGLIPGETVIRFTPAESGTHQYTCSMGMVTGKIIVSEDIA